MTPHDCTRSRAIDAIVWCLPFIPDAELCVLLDVVRQIAAAELERGYALFRREGIPNRDPKPEG